MKYYERLITVREPINRFGKIGFVEYRETVKTNNINEFNHEKIPAFLIPGFRHAAGFFSPENRKNLIKSVPK